MRPTVRGAADAGISIPYSRLDCRVGPGIFEVEAVGDRAADVGLDGPGLIALAALHNNAERRDALH
jgi:hypothetical protein